MEYLRKPLRYVFFVVEGWFDAIFGPKWNPFYCFGALGFFYFWVVGVSGVYIYIFFDTGIPQAYESVEYMTNDQWWLAGIMRSLHRYASDAMVIMMVLHMVREFAFDRYRGVRWYSWITGVPIVWLVMACGVSGYWLVWDTLAQYVAETATEWFDWLPIFGEPVARNFLAPGHLDGRFFTLMVFLHIAVPLILLFVMWFHLQRVGHAKMNPARGLGVGTFLMLLVLSIVAPATSQGIADLGRVPSPVGLDWYYLWSFPLIDLIGAGAMWAVAVFGTALLFLVPWLPPLKKEPVAEVHLEFCNGCGRCVDDCPFSAIRLVRRTDGEPFDHQAEVDASLCASCGICVGACPTATAFRRAGDLIPGIDIETPALAEVRAETERKAGKISGPARVIIFGCGYTANLTKFENAGTAVVGMPCVGMLPPSFIDYALTRNLADGVVLAACRPGECHFRKGQVWTEARVAGERDPRLRKRVPRERILEIEAAPVDWRRFGRDLEAFRGRLEQLPEEDQPRPEAAD